MRTESRKVARLAQRPRRFGLIAPPFPGKPPTISGACKRQSARKA